VAQLFVDGLLAEGGTVKVFPGQTLEFDASLSTNPDGSGLRYVWQGGLLDVLHFEETVSVVVPEELVGVTTSFTLHVESASTFLFDPVLSTTTINIEIAERLVKLSPTRVWVPSDNGPSVKNAFKNGSIIKSALARAQLPGRCARGELLDHWEDHRD
jgi:hypothetical protein